MSLQAVWTTLSLLISSVSFMIPSDVNAWKRSYDLKTYYDSPWMLNLGAFVSIVGKSTTFDMTLSYSSSSILMATCCSASFIPSLPSLEFPKAYMNPSYVSASVWKGPAENSAILLVLRVNSLRGTRIC